MLTEQVDEIYDSLMDKSGKHVAGITINLHDGRLAQALFGPKLMNKILGADI